MSTITEQVIQYVAEYNEKTEKFKKRIKECEERISDIGVEIQYINIKELPEAVEYRVLNNDRTHENKLRKTLEAIEAERQELAEELLVLDSRLNRILYESDDNAKEIRQLYHKERRIQAEKAYNKMMKAKQDYLDFIRKESEIMREQKDIASSLQRITYNAGRSNYTSADLIEPREFNISFAVTEMQAKNLLT